MKIYAEKVDRFGEDHLSTGLDTPMREDTFLMSDAEKILQIEENFRNIMHVLGLDLSDDSLRNTPHRVTKMYVEEFFSGLNPANNPSISMFQNRYSYNEMLVEKKSLCILIANIILCRLLAKYMWLMFQVGK